MPRSGAVAILLLLSLLPFPDSRAEEMINPHVKPEVCDACHIKVPTADDGERGDYFLAKETIDATCQVCHEYSCCKRGALGQFNHPSNISRWDWSKFHRPRVLPLYGGSITCTTCHFPHVTEEPTYRMVRIVRVEGKKIDWTELCHDCHVDY